MKMLTNIDQLYLSTLVSLFVYATCSAQQVLAEGFDITELDKGKAVTLPHPATTYIPVPHTVILGATDRGQTLKLVATAIDAKQGASPFQLVIHDPHADSARYLSLSPGQPVVYAFKAVGPIRLVLTDAPSGSPGSRNTRLQVESNRPLEVRSAMH